MNLSTDNIIFLLPEIKNYLDITWDDDGTIEKLKTIISSGCAKISALTDCSNDNFVCSPDHKSLLLEYCRLAWAGVPEKFNEFYKNEIVRLRLKKIAEGYDDSDIE